MQGRISDISNKEPFVVWYIFRNLARHKLYVGHVSRKLVKISFAHMTVRREKATKVCRVSIRKYVYKTRQKCGKFIFFRSCVE